MKKIIGFLKKRWLATALSLMAIFLLALKIVFNPPEEKPPVSPRLSPLPQPSSVYSQPLGSQISPRLLFEEEVFRPLPTNLPAFRTKNFSLETAIEFLSPVVAGLGFSGSPATKSINKQNHLIWQEKGNFLDAIETSGQFVFLGKYPLRDEKTTFDANQTVSAIKNRLSEWRLIEEGTEISSFQALAVVGQQLVAVENPADGQVFKISFRPKIENLPLVGFGEARHLVEVQIDNQNNLIKLSYFLHQIETKTAPYPLKGYSQIKKEIHEGKIQIIETFDTRGQMRSAPRPQEIKEVILAGPTLAYYEAGETQTYLLPIFLFSGTITLQDETTLSASFFLPAILEL